MAAPPNTLAAPRIGVLVVAYNAEHTLGATLDRIPSDFRPHIAEIIIADDASGDDTTGAAVRWRDSNPASRTTVIRHVENRGYGGNQKAGYQLAIERGLDVVVMLHGDGQYAPEFLPAMVDPIVNGDADAVFGSRMLERGAARKGGMPMYKYLGNKILTTLENRLLDTALSEFHSGYRAYRVSALRDIPFAANTDEFDFDTQIIVQLVDRQRKIVEIPIPTYYGDEICYVNGIKYAKDVVKDVVEYRASKAGFGLAEWVPDSTEYDVKITRGSSHELLLELAAQAPPGKVLDVGCSSGQFSERLRERGHYVVGIDALEHPDVHTRVDEFHLVDIQDGVPEVGTGYDLIIAGDVIEHVRDPEELLAKLAALLGPGGRLLVSTPNISHWYPRLRMVTGTFDYDRRGILDRTHLRFFSRGGFMRTVARSGLVIEELRYSGLPLGTRGRGLAARMCTLIDRSLVRLRPTLFGYQFVARLRVKNLDSVEHP